MGNWGIRWGVVGNSGGLLTDTQQCIDTHIPAHITHIHPRVSQNFDLTKQFNTIVYNFF